MRVGIPHHAHQARLVGPAPRVACEGHRPHRRPVVRAVAGEDLRAAGVVAGQLDRVLDGLRSAEREEDLVHVARQDLGQLRPQARPWLGREGGLDVLELRRLRRDGVDDPPIAVADVHAHQLAVEVDDAPPLGRVEVDPLRVVDGDRVELALHAPTEERVLAAEADDLLAGHRGGRGDGHRWGSWAGDSRRRADCRRRSGSTLRARPRQSSGGSGSSSVISAEWSRSPPPRSISRRNASATGRKPGRSTPAWRAVSRMMRASFSWIATRPPGVKSRSSIRSPWTSRTRLAAKPPSSASRTRAASTPAARAGARASPTAWMVEPTTSWLQALATIPAPVPPMWMMRLPMAASTGRARSRAASEPPTMIESVASLAPPSPPDTGASSRSAPTSAQRSARATKAEGSCVPMSTTISPARAPARSPRGPSSTASTAARSAGSRAARAPATTSFFTGPSERYWTTSGNPAHRMLRAIGRPMMPRPMNPTRTGPGADAAMSSPPRATRRLLQGL